MQEIIDELLSVADDVAYPLDEPDFDDIVRVEEAILLPLSRSMKTFLEECSHITHGRYEPVTVADEQSHTYLAEVTAKAWSEGIPRDCVPLCEHGANLFVVTLDDEVALYENGELSDKTWPSIWHWVEEVWIRDSEY